LSGWSHQGNPDAHAGGGERILGAMDDRYARDVFMVNQKMRSFGKSKFYIYDEQQQPLLYAERGIQFIPQRRNITMYADDTASQHLLTLYQEHFFELIRREYTITDERTGEKIGFASRHNIKSWFRRRWDVTDATGAEFVVRENSNVMTVVRRLVDWIPYVNLIGWLIPTNFEFYAADPAGLTPLGTFTRKRSITDKYLMDLNDDRARRFDRRLAVAMGVLLDTAEAR
jgi:hypothetical protein